MLNETVVSLNMFHTYISYLVGYERHPPFYLVFNTSFWTILTFTSDSECETTELKMCTLVRRSLYRLVEVEPSHPATPTHHVMFPAFISDYNY